MSGAAAHATEEELELLALNRLHPPEAFIFHLESCLDCQDRLIEAVLKIARIRLMKRVD